MQYDGWIQNSDASRKRTLVPKTHGYSNNGKNEFKKISPRTIQLEEFEVLFDELKQANAYSID